MQRQYWRFFIQLKVWQIYLDLYADNSYKWERRINMITAISASSSIAAWAIWGQMDFIWAIIIAISQVVNAIKPYLPYGKRLEMINPLINDLQSLYIKMEYNWFKVSNGEFKESEINDMLFGFKNEYRVLEKKNIKSNDLLQNEKLRRLADDRAASFIASNY